MAILVHNIGMNIVIATGLLRNDVGGPAQYAQHLYDEFRKRGHKVTLCYYAQERKMPLGVRHFFYFTRLLRIIFKADVIFALDTMSVGLPAVLAGVIARKKAVLRIGGDFLWESHVERVRERIIFPDFYKNFSLSRLNVKEKAIYWLSGFVLRNASVCAFNSAWQKNIFARHYGLDEKKCVVVENYFPSKRESERTKRINFLWAGRGIFLKNTAMLEDAFADAKKIRTDIELDMITGMQHEELIEKMKKCYAVILPSLSEMSPNFIIDAMSMNKPFIITRYNGLYEKIKDKGLFIDPLDKEDITKKILMLADKKIYDDYSKRIEDFHYVRTWKEVADDFLNIMQKTRIPL